jgi:hypothetical protein
VFSKIHRQSGGPEYMAAGGSEWAVASSSYTPGDKNVPQRQSGPWGLFLTAVFSPGSVELRKVENSKDRGWR